MPLTKMTPLTETLLHAWRAFVIAALLALTGCGPGTGGTGTGPSHGTYSFAGMVSNSMGSGPSTGLPCSDDCGVASLRLQPDLVELLAPCRRFVHQGAWALDAQGVASLDGRLETTSFANGQPSVMVVPAVLRLQFGEGLLEGRDVALSVRDAAGQLLMTPLTLLRGESAQGAGSCSAAH